MHPRTTGQFVLGLSLGFLIAFRATLAWGGTVGEEFEREKRAREEKSASVNRGKFEKIRTVLIPELAKRNGLTVNKIDSFSEIGSSSTLTTHFATTDQHRCEVTVYSGYRSLEVNDFSDLKNVLRGSRAQRFQALCGEALTAPLVGEVYRELHNAEWYVRAYGEFSSETKNYVSIRSAGLNLRLWYFQDKCGLNLMSMDVNCIKSDQEDKNFYSGILSSPKGIILDR